jgi:hypothetical protein
MFAFLTHGSVFWNYGVGNGGMEKVRARMNNKGEFISIPKDVFRRHSFEQFEMYFTNLKTIKLHIVSTDSISEAFCDKLELLNEKDYELVKQWHWITCEQREMWGCSSHMLYIAQKK